MNNLDKFLSELPPGRFTCGARYICFLKEGSPGNYRRLAEAPADLYDAPEWFEFAEAVCDALNAKHSALT
jgi:hypothetical protein